MLAVLLGLVGTVLLPDAVRIGGGATLLTAAVGLLLPLALERKPDALHRVHGVLTVVVVCGLGLHLAIDGAALALAGDPGVAAGHGGGGHGDHEMLGVAVLVHRLPMALFLFGLVRGTGQRLGLLVLAVAASVAGFTLAGQALPHLDAGWAAHLQALAAGGIAHVIAHPGSDHHHALSDQRYNRLSASGALAGVALLLLTMHWETSTGIASPDGQLPLTAMTLFRMAAPAWLVAVAVRMILDHRHGPRGGIPDACDAPSIMGDPSPRTPRARLGLLGAVPLLAPEALLLPIVFFGPLFAALRAAAALVVSAAGVLATRRSPGKEEAEQSIPEEARAPVDLGRSLDHMTPWMVVGLVLAGAIVTFLPADPSPSLGLGWEPATVVLAALLGAAGFLCGAALVPVAALLMLSGWTQGALLALLLTGPALRWGALEAVAKRLGRRSAWLWAAGVLSSSVAVGLLVDAGGGVPVWTLGEAMLRVNTGVADAALGLLGLGAVVSLFRVGPHGWLGGLVAGRHGHYHGPTPGSGG